MKYHIWSRNICGMTKTARVKRKTMPFTCPHFSRTLSTTHFDCKSSLSCCSWASSLLILFSPEINVFIWLRRSCSNCLLDWRSVFSLLTSASSLKSGKLLKDGVAAFTFRLAVTILTGHHYAWCVNGFPFSVEENTIQKGTVLYNSHNQLFLLHFCIHPNSKLQALGLSAW